MKNHLIILSLILTIVSCDQETEDPQIVDYSDFLAQTKPQFQFKIDDSSYYWEFAWRKFQSSYSTNYFALTSEDDFDINFKIYSPDYNFNVESEFLQIFSLGEKTLGDQRTNFRLLINTENNHYRTNDLYEFNEIEILKTQKFLADGSDLETLRVWFRIKASLSHVQDENDYHILSDGLMIAIFIIPPIH